MRSLRHPYFSPNRALIERFDQLARGLDDRAAARIGRGVNPCDPEANATFIRVGSRPVVRR